MSFYTRDFLAIQISEHGWDIGEYSYGAPIVHQWGADGHLKVGRYCSIGGGVEVLLGGNHRIDWATTYPFNAIRPEAAHIQGHPATKGDIVIGNDVWLGQKCVIMSGVTIGDGAVVAAHAVVAKDVPPYTVAGGNPAKPIRRRFTEEQILSLLDIRWWDWPDEVVRAAHERLQSDRIEDLIAYARTIPCLTRQGLPASTISSQAS